MHSSVHSGAEPEPSTSAYAMVAPILARQFCQIQHLGREHQVPASVSSRVLAAPVSTPLVVEAWRALQCYPARDWVECLFTGMHDGFRIGLVQTPHCQSSLGNTPSAVAKPEVVSDFL